MVDGVNELSIGRVLQTPITQVVHPQVFIDDGAHDASYLILFLPDRVKGEDDLVIPVGQVKPDVVAEKETIVQTTILHLVANGLVVASENV